VLENVVGCLKCSLNVTTAHFEVVEDVLARVDVQHQVGKGQEVASIDLVVDGRRVRLGGVDGIEHGRQVLVLDVDQAHSGLGLLVFLGNDDRDGLAGVAHLVRGHHRPVGQHRSIVRADARVAQVGARQHADDTGRPLGSRGVQAHDASMGERRPQDARVQQPRDAEVGRERQPPRHPLARLAHGHALAEVSHHLTGALTSLG
jgi:hypothetical protein